MEIEIKKAVKVQVKYLKVEAGVRYWEDASVNGIDETEDSTSIPFRNGEVWCPVIDLDAGKIADWPIGTTADVHYKVCDAGVYTLLDADHSEVVKIDGYVPDILSPGGSGYGDYIIMSISEDGSVAGWNPILSEFLRANN